MRQFQDYKKQFNFILLTLLIFAPLFSASAQSAQDLRDKIEAKNADIARLEREIKAYQAELSSLGAQRSTLAGEIKQLDLTRKKLNADISITEDKIDKTNLKIASLSKDIGNKEDSISTNLEAIAEGIRDVNEFEHSSLIEVMLSESDFSNAWNDLDNTMTIRQALRDNISSLREVKSDLEDTKDETTAARNELLGLKTKLADQKKIVDQNAAQKNTLLKQTQNSEANYQKLLANQLALKAAIEAEVQNYESQLKYILDPNKLPDGRVFSWPLENVYITQLFGRTVDAKRLYASGSHSGVDFRATVGTPVMAMADGVVGGTGDTDATCAGASFGKWVFIDYDNGLSSTYGHLSLVTSKRGQKVKRGEVVAYSGATGHVTGPHLHVTVYAPDSAKVQTLPSKSCPGKTLTQPIAATNAYLDPMLYLPPYK